MKISFVIPAYNEEVTIGNCLDSILRDVHTSGIPNWEIVVVNNASTDATRQVALERAGVRVVDEHHKGITFARQRGYKESTGDIIANVDADNLLTDGWTNRVLAEFKKNSDLIAFSGPVIYWDMPAFTRFLVRIYFYIAYVLYLFTRFVIKKGSMLQGGNFTVRKSALDTIGGFNTGIQFYGEDTDIACRLHPLGPVKFSLSHNIKSSGRRLRKEGVVSTAFRYGMNYFWVVVFKKPFTHTNQDIRPGGNVS